MAKALNNGGEKRGDGVALEVISAVWRLNGWNEKNSH
jgi:hypothetical protein